MDIIRSRVEYWSSMFIETVFEAPFSFPNVLLITWTTLSHVDSVGSSTSYMRFDMVRFTLRLTR